MRPKHSGQPKASAERVVKDIRRATRRHFSAEDKIRIVLEGLRGDDSISELCRKEGIAQLRRYDLCRTDFFRLIAICLLAKNFLTIQVS